MTHSSEIVGYTFDGAIYCTSCIKNPKSCTCPKRDRDENGICSENCHGYGPNPIFSGDVQSSDRCDSCGETISEFEEEEEVEEETEKEIKRLPRPYSLPLTQDDVDTIAFVGNRYCWSEALSILTVGENRLPEYRAWEIKEAIEEDDAFCPMLDPRSDLASKIQAFIEAIV